MKRDKYRSKIERKCPMFMRRFSGSDSDTASFSGIIRSLSARCPYVVEITWTG